MASSQRTLTNLGMNLSAEGTLSHLAGYHNYSGPLLHSDEKAIYSRKAREYTEKSTGHPSTLPNSSGGSDATPEHGPHGDYEDRVSQARMRHYITCLPEEMKRYTRKVCKL